MKININWLIMSFRASTIIGLLVLSNSAVAQNKPEQTQLTSIPVKVSEQGKQTIDKPDNGLSMQAVETRYGQPLEKAAPVGEPPITRWRYPDFTVYFEFNKVIHSVANPS